MALSAASIAVEVADRHRDGAAKDPVGQDVEQVVPEIDELVDDHEYDSASAGRAQRAARTHGRGRRIPLCTT